MDNENSDSGDFSHFLGHQIQNTFYNASTHQPISVNVHENGGNIAATTLFDKNAHQELLKKINKLESLLNMYSDLHRQSGQGNKIDRLARISGKKFFKEYYYKNMPVILTDMMKRWPALKKWSPDFFLKEFKDVPVEITQGRSKNPTYEKNFRSTVNSISFSEFIHLIREDPESNDIYLVARNYFFSNPVFHVLQNDVLPPGDLIDSDFPGSQKMKLWFGPGGTLTPLHHDKHSILFCQIYGRKHFKMIPSFDLPNIYNRDRYYSELDLEDIHIEKHPKFLNASVADVIINPGEMLFIPAGWWHWVKSLDISISVTFSNFQVPGYNTPWQCE